MFQTKNNTPRTKLGARQSKHSLDRLRSNYGSVKNRGGRASQLGRQQSVCHTMDDLVEPPPRSGKSRRGSLLQQVGRRQQQPMNEQPSSQIEEHEQVEEEYLQQTEERSGRTRSTPLPTRSPPRRGRGGRRLPITPSRLPVNDDDFLDSPRRSPRGLGSNRVVTRRSNDFINSLRRSPRGLSNNRVQRSLEPEYNTSNAGQMQRHRQNQHQSNQLYNTQRQSQTPSNGAPLRNRNILQQNHSRSEPQQNDTPEDQHLPRQHPSRSASNSPQSNEECGTAETSGKKKRGRSCMKELAKFGGKILELDLHGGDYVYACGPAKSNCPLNYDEFDDIPLRKFSSDQQTLCMTTLQSSLARRRPREEAIKKIMRNAYNRHRHKIHKENKPCDAVIFVLETHGSKNYHLEMSGEMKKQPLRGENLVKLQYDIYRSIIMNNVGVSTNVVALASHTHKSLADIMEKEIQLLNGRIERQTRRLTNLMNSFFLNIILPCDLFEVRGRDDEDLDVEGQNDEDDYDDMEDNFIRDHPDMEHPKCGGGCR
ncbi:hypothetical protein MKW92_005192 [Papaver armeniacum]|nr:hypothetical protein MKW92_005192 [Papaver armeniacum]